jgi:hypothetical protein
MFEAGIYFADVFSDAFDEAPRGDGACAVLVGDGKIYAEQRAYVKV